MLAAMYKARLSRCTAALAWRKEIFDCECRECANGFFNTAKSGFDAGDLDRGFG